MTTPEKIPVSDKVAAIYADLLERLGDEHNTINVLLHDLELAIATFNEPTLPAAFMTELAETENGA